ncbi:SepM family pheromone-processing serine protease [Paenibacillus sabinae]|uniref:endopeptidase La n=1 Tax=Paenibacillus sabinae T27 TaxID=1268072 RepID=X5A098_9BACL|nr:SepM family pheromone-processing serine protease [Paenibacillus sabinae]AHV97299.1 peptidase S16 lon domain-containing protein [Paenibacillus sabinae T27]
MRQSRNRTGIRAGVYLFTLIVLIYVIVFMGTPYVVYQPGAASEVAPMIKVENEDGDEAGTFMMTTVSASYANVALLIYSALNPNAEIARKAERLGNQSEDEYAATQVYYMSSSQSNAVEAAYKAAGIPYRDVTDYLFVFSVPGETGHKQLQPGDKILVVDGQQVANPEELSKLLSTRKVGDEVAVSLERKGKKLTEDVTLVEIKDSGKKAVRPGLGVVIGAIQKVKASEPGREVSFTDTDVGGPSAGLMFTMEIYNRLTKGDLTKGYRVAGTGTIDPKGEVGPIGGVQFKIVAAERKGAEIFFVPVKNFEEAKAKADKIGAKMKLVPVSTLDQAIQYMKKLPVKP